MEVSKGWKPTSGLGPEMREHVFEALHRGFNYPPSACSVVSDDCLEQRQFAYPRLNVPAGQSGQKGPMLYASEGRRSQRNWREKSKMSSDAA